MVLPSCIKSRSVTAFWRCMKRSFSNHLLSVSYSFIVYKDFLQCATPKVLSVLTPAFCGWMQPWEPAGLWNVSVDVVTGVQRQPALAISVGVLWQCLQRAFVPTAAFLLPCSPPSQHNGRAGTARAWGVRSGVRYLRPFSHSNPVWVILDCVKKEKKIKKKNWRGLEGISRNITLQSAGPRH